MTDPQTITQLIEDLQAAEVGTRELDLGIAKACGHEYGKRESVDLESRSFTIYQAEKEYSTSIDAAMTAIREGWEWVEGRIVRRGGDYVGAAHVLRELSQGTITKGWHKRHEIAICIASLYAILKELETT